MMNELRCKKDRSVCVLLTLLITEMLFDVPVTYLHTAQVPREPNGIISTFLGVDKKL